MTPTKVLIGQMLVVFGVALAGTRAATQWVAYSLGFQQRLGEPWFLIADLPVYYPWRLFEWWYVYDAYAPDIFRTGGNDRGRQRRCRRAIRDRGFSLASAASEACHDLRFRPLG